MTHSAATTSRTLARPRRRRALRDNPGRGRRSGVPGRRDSECQLRRQRDHLENLLTISDGRVCLLVLKSVLTSLCRGPHPSAVNVTLPEFAAERRRASSTALVVRSQLLIDIFCRQGAQQQTHLPPPSTDCTDEQTDGRTPDRYVDSAPLTMRTASIMPKAPHITFY